MSIKKLPEEDPVVVFAVIRKLNELIDAHNELERKYDFHRHLVTDAKETTPPYIEEL